MNIWLQIATIVAGVLGGGGFVAFLGYLSSRPENLAKAKQVNVTAEVTLGEGWKAYAEKMEKRLDEMEARYQGQINEKDQEISSLKKRVGDLENELAKYQSTEVKIITKGPITE